MAKREETMDTFGDMIDRKVVLMATDTEIGRGICQPWVPFYQRLWDDGTIGALCDQRLLLDTRPRNRNRDTTSGELLFSQPRLPFVSYPHEWSASMFKAAAGVCLSLHEALFEKGLCLIDSHPWNVLFNAHTPLWVDMTSMEPYEPATARQSLFEFRKTFLNAIDLLYNGNEEIVRSILAHRFSSIPDSSHHAIVPGGAWRQHRWGTRLPRAFVQTQLHSIRTVRMDWHRFRQFRAADFSTARQAMRVIERLRKELDRFPTTVTQQRSSRNSPTRHVGLSKLELENQTLGAHPLKRSNVPAIDNWLDRLKSQVRTVLDLGCNMGVFAQMAAMKGYIVAGVDSNSSAIDNLYLTSRKEGIPISCGIADFVSPRDGQGMVTNPLPRFFERFRADLVVCTGESYQLYFGTYLMNFRTMARLFSMYTSRFLIVEFVPNTDPIIKRQLAHEKSEVRYTVANFASELSRCFRIIEVHPSLPEGRTLYFMEKLP